jgi:hypothetical protein
MDAGWVLVLWLSVLLLFHGGWFSGGKRGAKGAGRAGGFMVA